VLCCTEDYKGRLHSRERILIDIRIVCPVQRVAPRLIITALRSNGQAIMFYSCDLLWPPYGIQQVIIFSSSSFFFLSFFFLSFFFLFFLAYFQPSQIGCLSYFHTWCGHSSNLGCRSETCCTRLGGNIQDAKIAKNSPSEHHRTVLSGYIFAPIDNRKENLLSSNISSTCPDNMVHFGILTAEICWRVWGTPTNFNGFCVLAALLHGI